MTDEMIARENEATCGLPLRALVRALGCWLETGGADAGAAAERRAIAAFALFAVAKAEATDLRLEGAIEAAIGYEDQAERYYAELPADWRW